MQCSLTLRAMIRQVLANMQNQCESLHELTYKEKVLISFGYNQIVYLLS